jgi:hypothetical protein
MFAAQPKLKPVDGYPDIATLDEDITVTPPLDPNESVIQYWLKY